MLVNSLLTWLSLPFLAGKDFNYSSLEFVDGFLKYGFNTILSKSLGSEREVPDTRDKR